MKPEKPQKRHGDLNLVACRDGVTRHWYEAFPRPEWTQK